MRIGIDLGGTKISVLALDEHGASLFETRVKTPQDDYRGTVQSVRELVGQVERETGLVGSVGMGMPGSISPRTGLVQNANSTWLNGKPFHQDMEVALDRQVRLANDANCFALSEATDGAGQNYHSVFGVILGTGCGGGLVLDKRLINGPRNISGEWGHVSLPWATPEEYPGPSCWCGLKGCMECFVSGPAVSLDHYRHTGEHFSAEQLHQRALGGNEAALASFSRHTSRLARGLAMVSNIFDPDIIVLGGGLSKMPHLYEQLPDAMVAYLFTDDKQVVLTPPKHGDASGVRGAAWLWNKPL